MSAPVSEERMLRELRGDVASLVERVGLMARVFGRFKTPASIDDKFLRKGYVAGGRLMQDLIGVRVAAYFFDDLPIIRDLLIRRFGAAVEEVKDAPNQTTFQPIRWNLVFRLPETIHLEASRYIRGRPIDTTFEVQLRTVLAEGWHEVEHDLRYKRPTDWSEEPDMSRIFNGLLASLENADWTMLQLFERLAYQKYKNRQWESMIRMKYRVHLSGSLSASIAAVLDEDHSTGKQLFRASRNAIVRRIHAVADELPLTVNNFVYMANRVTGHDGRLIALEPRPVTQVLEAVPNGACELANRGAFDMEAVGRAIC